MRLSAESCLPNRDETPGARARACNALVPPGTLAARVRVPAPALLRVVVVVPRQYGPVHARG